MIPAICVAISLLVTTGCSWESLLWGGGGGIFGTSAYSIAFWAEACNSEPQTYSLYETEESSLGGTFHGSVLENEMSTLSVSNEGLTIMDASVSLIKGSWQKGDVIIEPYSCLNAEASASITKNGLTVSAMASVWDFSGSIHIWGITVTGTVHLGAVGGEFAMGPKGFTWGALAFLVSRYQLIGNTYLRRTSQITLFTN